MPRLLFHWIFVTLAIMAVPYLVSGVTVDTVGSAIAAAAVLGVLNVFLRPLLILFTLPLTLISLGFFIVFINAFCFYLTAKLVSGIEVESFWSSLFASLVISLVSWAANLSIHKRHGRTRIIVTHGSAGSARPMRDVNPGE